ncbi:dnaJ homolog subfamily C member 28-like [Argopecten irradians]|uniref:dnaJ homolog subfamily C member 28-like n=1 Tax=Argopecten irradians TaxID=31199 RepID=UPI00371ED0E5
MIGPWCARVLRQIGHSPFRTLQQPLLCQNVSTTSAKRMISSTAQPVPRPSKDKDMKELEKEIRNDLSVYNRTKSTIVHRRRHSKEMVSPRDIEQIVDSHVLDAMQKGDFDNLPGFGKPFKEEYENPFLETGLAKINSILKSEGYTPSWILLGKEIREGIKKARFTLALERSRLKNINLTTDEQARLKVHKERFERTVSRLNEQVHKHNLEVPLIRMQRVAFSIENETKKVLDNHQAYIPADFKDTATMNYHSRNDGLSGVWKDVMEMFKK